MVNIPVGERHINRPNILNSQVDKKGIQNLRIIRTNLSIIKNKLFRLWYS